MVSSDIGVSTMKAFKQKIKHDFGKKEVMCLTIQNNVCNKKAISGVIYSN